MFAKLVKKWKTKQNEKEIRKETWEFKELFEEMARVHPAPRSIENLLKNLYAYTYVHVFLNQQPLEHVFFQIEHKRLNHTYSRDSYWDVHTITIEFDAFLYEIRYSFDKMPRWNLAGHNGVCLQKDGLKHAQIFLKGKEPLPLLEKKQSLEQSFAFKEDVPEKIQEKVDEVFSFVEMLKENAWHKRNKTIKNKMQQQKEQDQKRKDTLESY